MPIINPSDYTKGKPQNFTANHIYNPRGVDIDKENNPLVFLHAATEIPISDDRGICSCSYIIIEDNKDDLNHILICGMDAEIVEEEKLWRFLRFARDSEVISQKQYERCYKDMLYSFALYIYANENWNETMRKKDKLDKLILKQYSLEKELKEITQQIEEME